MIGLSIAGFDPSGGAGILTDIKTMAAHGVHGASVVTALTAQNPKKVFSVKPISPQYICEQIDSIFDDYDIKYSKTGLLFSKEIIKSVSKKVDEYNLSLVVDPVMVATSGDALMKAGIAEALKNELFPIARIITPNIPEAETLTGLKISNVDEMKDASDVLSVNGLSVLLKGGHLDADKLVDVLQTDDGAVRQRMHLGVVEVILDGRHQRIVDERRLANVRDADDHGFQRPSVHALVLIFFHNTRTLLGRYGDETPFIGINRTLKQGIAHLVAVNLSFLVHAVENTFAAYTANTAGNRAAHACLPLDAALDFLYEIFVCLGAEHVGIAL